MYRNEMEESFSSSRSIYENRAQITPMYSYMKLFRTKTWSQRIVSLMLQFSTSRNSRTSRNYLVIDTLNATRIYMICIGLLLKIPSY